MATESKVTEPKSEVPEPKITSKAAPKPVYIKTVYGRMVDPLTALEYTGIPSELYKRTSWVDSQLEAKKLELCDPLDQPTDK